DALPICLDGAGDRPRPRNGAELVAEHGPAVGGHIVLAVVQADGRGLGGGVDAPGPGKPAPVQGVGRDQTHRRDQDDYKCVHDVPLLSLGMQWVAKGPWGPRPPASRCAKSPRRCAQGAAAGAEAFDKGYAALLLCIWLLDALTVARR